MGEHQCHFCGHITTGFEEQEFHARQHELDTLKATIATLEQQLAEVRADREEGVRHVLALENLTALALVYKEQMVVKAAIAWADKGDAQPTEHAWLDQTGEQ